MKIPEEFIGCRIQNNRPTHNNYGEVIGKIVSCYSENRDAWLLVIKNDGSFERWDVDYVKIVKEDMFKVRSGLVIKKSDRFEILDL
jgi:hypothetical protein